MIRKRVIMCPRSFNFSSLKMFEARNRSMCYYWYWYLFHSLWAQTLDRAMEKLNIREFSDSNIKQTVNRSRDSDEETTALSTVFSIPLQSKNTLPAKFQVHFEFIPGILLFLIGWVSWCAMNAKISCEYFKLGMNIEGTFIRTPLNSREHHVYLHFSNQNRARNYKPKSYCNPEKQKNFPRRSWCN